MTDASSTTPPTMPPTTPPTGARIDLYWRPGCGFCSRLQGQLDRLGIERVEHDIWSEPEHAAVVRRHADGNETVPTVVVGDQGFVNPSAAELVAYLLDHHPELLPDGVEVPQQNPVSRFVNRVLR